MALTEKQRRFVEEYLVDLNATQAAARAGYKDPNIGRQLITKNNVSDAIQKAMVERSTRTGITQDMVLKELANVAFANGTDFAKVVYREIPTDVMDDDGSIIKVMRRQQMVEIRDTDSVPPEKRAAIAGIKEGKYGIEVTSYDKLRALELLGKHLGMFKNEVSQKPSGENNLLQAIKDIEEINTDDLPEVE